MTANDLVRKELARRELAKRDMLSFIRYFREDYLPGWVHQELCQLMDAFIEAVKRKGSPRIIISIAPRVGKSTIVSEFLPAYILGLMQTWEVVGCTYNQTLADTFGRKVRDRLQDPKFLDLFDVELDKRSQSADFIRLSKGGSYTGVGMGGALTGKGCHCVVGETKLQTPDGERSIYDLVNLTDPGKVLAYDHRTNSLCFRQITGVSIRPRARIRRITTSAGNVVETSDGHPFFVVGKGYLRADQLAPGDTLLRSVPEIIRSAVVRNGEGNPKRENEPLLFDEVFVSNDERSTIRREKLQMVRGSNYTSSQRSVLLGGVQVERVQESRGEAAQANNDTLPSVWGGFSSEIPPTETLLKGMREQGTLTSNDWEWKLYLEGRTIGSIWGSPQLDGIQIDAPENYASGFARVRRVRLEGEVACAPHRLGLHEQCGVKSGNDVLIVPYDITCCGEGTIADTISMVEVLHDEREVYNIAVDGTENFFANGILTHNCMIIDDPVKDRAQAESQIESDNAWDWYSSTARTRLHPGGGIIVVQTRWAINDLSGRLIDSANADRNADQWTVYSFPALAEHDEKHRKAGEPLHPERYSREDYLRIKATIEPRDWAALYQCKPYIESGAFFNVDTIKYYDTMPDKDDLAFCLGVDYATSASKKSDKSAIVPLGVTHDGNIYVSEDFIYDHLDSWDAVEKTLELAKKHSARDLGGEAGPIQNTMGPIFQRLQEQHRWYVTINKNVRRTSKSVAAHTMRALMSAGKLYFPKTPRVERDIVPELLRFDPRVDRGGDDFIDAVVNGLLLIDNIGRPSAPLPPAPKWREAGKLYGDDIWKKKGTANSTIPKLSGRW